jgi:hypothetical protein
MSKITDYAFLFQKSFGTSGVNGLYKSCDCIKEYHAIRNKYF